MKALTLSERAGHLASIETILNAGGAHPWTPAMIEDHKAHELAKAPPPSFLWHYHESIRKVNLPIWRYGDTVAGYFASAAVVAAVLAIITFAIYLPLTAHVLCIAAGAFVLLAALCLGAHSLAWKIASIHVRPPAQWRAIPVVGKCDIGTMPPEAQMLVRAVRQFKPDASITVHELRQGVFLLDPILEVEGRYVMVWDEYGTIVLPH